MPRQFVLPDLGEGITEAQVIRVLIQEGAHVQEDQSLMEVETDKAAVEIPSPYAGIASRVHVKEGETINVGAVVVTFDDGKAAASTPAPAGQADKSASAAVPSGSATNATAPASVPGARVAGPAQRASTPSEASRRTTVAAAPAVRKLAREMGIDLDLVAGSGPGGRVPREDVEGFAKGGATPATAGAPSSPQAMGTTAARGEAPPAPAQRAVALEPASPPPGVAGQDKYGPIRTDKISQIRKTISTQMKRSAYTAVHVTHCDEVNVTELERVRRQMNELTGGQPKITAMAFVVRACCIALRNHPVFNSSFDEENGQVIYKEYYNVGVAVDTPRGLIVPVIRHADRLTLAGVAHELNRIAENVRTGNFAIEDIRGGTFTITNVGALGGTVSTPIINYPEVAILGMGRSRKVPVFDKQGNVVPALMLPVNLSFDHRATDGAASARFVGEIISYLENPAKFLLWA